MPREEINDAGRLQIHTAIQEILRPCGFTEITEGSYSNCGWFFQAESDEFIVTAEQVRSGDVFTILVGSKKGGEPYADERFPWSLSHLRGYIDGLDGQYEFKSAVQQLGWFGKHVNELLDSTVLNSEELNSWATEQARKMFG